MDNNIIDAEVTDIQVVGKQPLAVQNTSPVMQLADKLASGTITAEQMEKFNEDGSPKPGYDDQGNTVLEDDRGASRLSERIITSNNFDEDLELIKSAKPGQIIVLSDGRKFKKNP